MHGVVVALRILIDVGTRRVDNGEHLSGQILKHRPGAHTPGVRRIRILSATCAGGARQGNTGRQHDRRAQQARSLHPAPPSTAH